MFGNLLNKILPKKKTTHQLTSRELSGRNNVGYPTMQISREIDTIINQHYRDIKPLIKFYKETFLFKWGPAIINNTLSDDQLKRLSGRNVQMMYLLLFRDMLRQISSYVTPKNSPDKWYDCIAQEVLDNCKMLNDTDDKDIATKTELFNQCLPYNIASEEPQPWAEPIAKLICIPAKDLYYWHYSLTNTILKKVKKRSKK